MKPIRAILCPVDFSEGAQQAFGLGEALANDADARLLVLHVATPPLFVAQRELQQALEQPDGYRGQLEDELRSFCTPTTSVAVEYRVVAGDPAAEIVGIARESGCDLIVMGTHGRTGMARLLVGSVAEQVLRKAHCPVVTIKMPASRLRGE